MDHSHGSAVLYNPSEMAKGRNWRVFEFASIAIREAYIINRPSPIAPYSLEVYASTFTTPFTVNAGDGSSFVRIHSLLKRVRSDIHLQRTGQYRLTTERWCVSVSPCMMTLTYFWIQVPSMHVRFQRCYWRMLGRLHSHSWEYRMPKRYLSYSPWCHRHCKQDRNAG